MLIYFQFVCEEMFELEGLDCDFNVLLCEGKSKGDSKSIIKGMCG